MKQSGTQCLPQSSTAHTAARYQVSYLGAHNGTPFGHVRQYVCLRARNARAERCSRGFLCGLRNHVPRPEASDA